MRLSRAAPRRRVLLAASPGGPGRPDRPIRLIVPFPLGGPVVSSARIVAQALTEELRSAGVVENRSGADGRGAGTNAVAKSAPDGDTSSFSSTGAVAANVQPMPNTPHDPRANFAAAAAYRIVEQAGL